MQVDLAGKAALVTGAARRIGKAIAEALGRSGAQVVYTDADGAEADRAAAATSGAVAMEMDVTDRAQVQTVTEQMAAWNGRVDVLVNNAGVNTLAHRVPIDRFPQEEWDRIVDVDLRIART